MFKSLIEPTLLTICLGSLMYSLCVIMSAFAHLFRDKYETNDMLSAYIKTQYESNIQDDFYFKVAAEADQFITTKSAFLDVGCAVGRMVFEYEKKGFQNCIGIDTSKQFIRYCKKLISRTLKKSQSNFICGNIEDYNFNNQHFDVILCLNVVDRVKNPLQLLQKLHSLLSCSGLLIISTPYDWENSPAPKEYQFNDLSAFFNTHNWNIRKVVKKVPYKMFLSDREIEYRCDVVIATKV